MSLVDTLEKVWKSIRFSHIKKQITCPVHWYGNDYGGFYLNPNIIKDGSTIYSFGIGEDISFDKAVLEAHTVQIFGFDPTPKSIKWCSTNSLPKYFIFKPFGIAKVTGPVTFNLPINSDHVSGSVIQHKNVNSTNAVEVQMKSFKDTLQSLKHTNVDIIKMDIEGSEYDIIEDILKLKLDISQIVVEFHERFFTDGKLKTKKIIKLMNEHGYKIFAISRSYEEVSFVKEEKLS